MIIAAIRKLYEEGAEPSRGNPTGSRFGMCAAQSQLLRFPELSEPEPPSARRRMNFEAGDRIEAWWGEAIERAFPNVSGLTQEPFYFPVPISGPDFDRLASACAMRQNALGMARLWGTVIPGFVPPSIAESEKPGRLKIRLIQRDRDGTAPRKLGFVLDPDGGPMLWAPTYVDRVIKHPEYGLRILEKKSMSDWGFRRALLGRLDYGYRCQLAGFVKATGLDVVLLAFRKETAHLAELAYTRGTTGSRVDIFKLNGQVETYFARGQEEALSVSRPCPKCGQRQVPGPGCEECGGTGEIAAAIPGDQEWDIAQAWTPYDDALVAAIQERIRRVLLWDGSRAMLLREYGPSFLCPKCGGAGQRTCPQCKGTGKTPKKGNPCGPCGGAMRVTCETCEGAGMLSETTLGFPCSYCAVIHACWQRPEGSPLYRLEVTDKPKYIVARADWDAAGLTFTPPEGAAP